ELWPWRGGTTHGHPCARVSRPKPRDTRGTSGELWRGGVERRTATPAPEYPGQSSGILGALRVGWCLGGVERRTATPAPEYPGQSPGILGAHRVSCGAARWNDARRPLRPSIPAKAPGYSGHIG